MVIDRVVVFTFPNESSNISQAPQKDFGETGRGKNIDKGSRFSQAIHILPSLPRVINFKFLPQPHRNIALLSMKNSAFHSLLG